MSKVFMNLYFLAGSKSHEYEADKYGMHLMDKSKYNPKAALYLQEVFMKITPKKPTFQQNVFNFISTHPSSNNRFIKNQETLEEIQTQKQSV
ncbi:MAG: Beta-barrel assembly-enhancing protease [Candidatus Anoxychlamydiales bacterium]|nr:Beta-barrel assembly-enhancing protease [Candidatus Anoxychlamydiales bacterium]